jgi:hypothetical protein
MVGVVQHYGLRWYECLAPRHGDDTSHGVMHADMDVNLEEFCAHMRANFGVHCSPAGAAAAAG